MAETFTCSVCDQTKPVLMDGGTGYGNRTDDGGREAKVCYACCAVFDRSEMVTYGNACLYLTGNGTSVPYAVTNWPNSLSFHVPFSSKSKAWGYGGSMKRVDVWFRGPDGFIWHGVNKGDNQICRCRRTKRTKF